MAPFKILRKILPLHRNYKSKTTTEETSHPCRAEDHQNPAIAQFDLSPCIPGRTGVSIAPLVHANMKQDPVLESTCGNIECGKTDDSSSKRTHPKGRLHRLKHTLTGHHARSISTSNITASSSQSSTGISTHVDPHIIPALPSLSQHPIFHQPPPQDFEPEPLSPASMIIRPIIPHRRRRGSDSSDNSLPGLFKTTWDDDYATSEWKKRRREEWDGSRGMRRAMRELEQYGNDEHTRKKPRFWEEIDRLADAGRPGRRRDA